MDTVNNPHTDCLTVDVKTCAQMLGLGLRSTYRLVEQSYREKQPLRVLRFGTTYRIVTKSILTLVYGNTGG
jgi:hypothetical protein